MNTQSTNLKGNTSIFGKFSKETFKQAQEQDKSLSKVRYLADKEMSGYGYKEGLIIRKFKGKDNQSSIVVPSSLRMEVLKLAHDSVFAGHLGITATKKILNEQIHMARRHKRHCELYKILRSLPKTRQKEAKITFRKNGNGQNTI